MGQDIDLKQLFEKFEKRIEAKNIAIKEEEIQKKEDEKEVDELFFEELLETEDKKEWYVIHTYSGQEQKVKDNIEMRVERKGLKDKIGKIIIPTESVIEIKNGKRKEVKKKIFPGYLLIQIETEERLVRGEKKYVIDESVLFEIRNISGVTNFVNSGWELLPLPKHEVKSILQKTVATASKPETTFEINDMVKIMTGPFTDFTGIIQEIDEEKSKLKVLVDIFGRNTSVELSFEQVKKEK